VKSIYKKQTNKQTPPPPQKNKKKYKTKIKWKTTKNLFLTSKGFSPFVGYPRKHCLERTWTWTSSC